MASDSSEPLPQIRILKLKEESEGADTLQMTAEQRIAMMWPLAREAWGFAAGAVDVPMDRRMVRVFRR